MPVNGMKSTRETGLIAKLPVGLVSLLKSGELTKAAEEADVMVDGGRWRGVLTMAGRHWGL